VQAFTAEFIDAARPARHGTGDRWFLDETYGRYCVGGSPGPRDWSDDQFEVWVVGRAGWVSVPA
jgi:hypothetical protein